MRTRTISFVFLMLLVAACVVPITAAASVQGSFQRTIQVNGPADLEVLTRSGDITIHSGPAGTVSISGKIHVGDRWFAGKRQEEVREIEKNPPIRQSGNIIRIDYLNVRNVSIDYDITVPADTKVRTRSGSGDQTVEGLKAALDLESGSGDMRLANLTSDVRVHTGSGNVEARDLTGGFNAEAGSGDISVNGKGISNAQVHTGSGNIELHGVNGALRAEAGSGDISVDGTQTSSWEVRTGSGNVELQLPAQAGFELAASTGSGSVVVDRPVTMTIQSDVQRSQRSIKGTVRGGGPLLTVRTGSGDVHIN